MKIAICDDDREILAELRKLILEFFSDKSTETELSEFSDGEQLIHSGERFDLAVIDVEMPRADGIKAAKYVQTTNENALIIIVTGHEDYLDAAMEINVYRFLPKPISKERFFRGLDGAVTRYLRVSQPVLIETENEILRLNTGDILYLVIENRYITVYAKDRIVPTKKTMTWWRSYLNPDIFTQCHKSYLVNMRYVTNFNRESITLSSEGKTYTCHCSRRFYLKFKENFFSFLALNKCSGRGI